MKGFVHNSLPANWHTEIKMRQMEALYALAFAFSLTGVLPGCATYEKCGIGACPGDAKITANVQARLAQHPEIGPLEVQTLNGVVYEIVADRRARSVSQVWRGGVLLHSLAPECSSSPIKGEESI
jgi:hypothetical protein